MPRACSICTSPHLAAISKALAAGGALRPIAERFGVTHTSIQRHKVSCLRQPARSKRPPEPSSEPVDPVSSRFDCEDPKSLVKTTARLVDEALSLMEHAKRESDRKTALASLREARDGLALLMRAAGLLAGDSAVTIDARRLTVNAFSELSLPELRALAAGASDNQANRTLAPATVSLPSDALEAAFRPESRQDGLDAASGDALPQEHDA